MLSAALPSAAKPKNNITKTLAVGNSVTMATARMGDRPPCEPASGQKEAAPFRGGKATMLMKRT
jgi:hypothetical protein